MAVPTYKRLRGGAKEVPAGFAMLVDEVQEAIAATAEFKAENIDCLAVELTAEADEAHLHLDDMWLSKLESLVGRYWKVGMKNNKPIFKKEAMALVDGDEGMEDVQVYLLDHDGNWYFTAMPEEPGNDDQCFGFAYGTFGGEITQWPKKVHTPHWQQKHVVPLVSFLARHYNVGNHIYNVLVHEAYTNS